VRPEYNQKQLFSEPFSQQLRPLIVRELPTRFFEGLLNPSGVAVERFFDLLAVKHREWVEPGGNCSSYA
jgi:hypothetical protein